MEISPSSLDTAEDLAKFLKLSVSYIRRLTRTAGLPAVRIGRSVRYDRQAILTWLQARAERQGTGMSDTGVEVVSDGTLPKN
jgi:excisionase family DNA binding protein